MKKLHTKQFRAKGNQNIGNMIDKFCKANEIELNDISQVSFSTDHSSAIIVFLSDKDKFASEPKEEKEEE